MVVCSVNVGEELKCSIELRLVVYMEAVSAFARIGRWPFQNSVIIKQIGQAKLEFTL